MSERAGIVAAMEAEIAPLVRGWQQQFVRGSARRITVFESEKAVIAHGGMGREGAAAAATVLVEKCNCKYLLSCGLAGALNSRLRIGEVHEPELIWDADSGVSFRVQGGKGTLVTASRVLGTEEKRRLAEKYSADAVDMEAAAVADVAAKKGLPFLAVKAISDSLEFPMPNMDRFIGADGHFAIGKFILYTAFRPKSWPAIGQLARNSSLATRNLCARLQHLIDNEELRPNAINLKHT